MFDLNRCSPLWDSLPDGRSLYLRRILLAVDILLLVLLHHALTLYASRRLSKVPDAPAKAAAQKRFDVRPSPQDWRRLNLLILGDHIVALAFVMSFGPYEFEMLLGFAFLAVRLVYDFRFFRQEVETRELKTGALADAVMRTINLALLVAAMVSVSRTAYDAGGACLDPSYNF